MTINTKLLTVAGWYLLASLIAYLIIKTINLDLMFVFEALFYALIAFFIIVGFQNLLEEHHDGSIKKWLKSLTS
jgi:hypothetical protein